MSTEAVTLSAQRVFAGNVMVTWTPSSTTSEVKVLITVGGAFAWQETFTPDNTTANVKASGDTWSLDGGSFTVQYSAEAKSGTLRAHNWSYTVEETSHHFDGAIGGW
jgi:hypothetical protein